jgi:hypothetical protein
MTGDAGAGQPQSRLEPWDEQALEALRLGWGEAYEIGYDDERGWWAARRDRIGGLFTAADPEALRDYVREDYGVKPVPRDLPAATL